MPRQQLALTTRMRMIYRVDYAGAVVLSLRSVGLKKGPSSQ
jgi:hypothetical protein